ncbi:MAG: zinc ribbon domain-containing protein [Ignavibacteriaceae bacterium]|nr:zinc ribbon domain-containing protein [Ignavibacteriaceae bacterium]
MPTYEYKCKKCGNVFEVFHSMNAHPVIVCPKCGGDVKKLISAGSTPIFKGSGFYQTDYKDKTFKDKSKEPVRPKPKNKPEPPAKSE